MNKTTSSVIETTRYMIGALPEELRANVISGICARNQLTEEFISEFKKYITPSMFSSSYKLTCEMADNHPELFVEETFLNHVAIKTEKPLSTVTSGENSSIAINTRKYGHDAWPTITISMLARYLDKIKAMDESNGAPFSGRVMNCISTADVSELNNTEDIMTIINADFNNTSMKETIDNIVMTRVSDPDLRHSLLLAMAVSHPEKISAAMLRYMDNDTKAALICGGNIGVTDFINMLSMSNDYAWVCEMINGVDSGKFSFRTTETADTQLVTLFINITEEQIMKMLKLQKDAPNLFSYKVMYWLLKNKDFTEEQLIEMKDLFKNAGMYFELKKHATSNDMQNLLAAMK